MLNSVTDMRLIVLNRDDIIISKNCLDEHISEMLIVTFLQEAIINQNQNDYTKLSNFSRNNDSTMFLIKKLRKFEGKKTCNTTYDTLNKVDLQNILSNTRNVV